MKILILSYSLTGNNKALAGSLAEALMAEHIRVTESKPRTTATIAWDMLFNRTPKVNPAAETIDGYDLVIFVAPVWMGQVAAPLRAYLKYLKGKPVPYGFISISGGADGGNPKLGEELIRRVGMAPDILLDLHITDLLPTDPRPDRNTTSAYKVSERDLKILTAKALKAVETMKEVKVPGTKHIHLEPLT